MESLYRKYRPKTFDEVVGQQHVVETLEHAVLEGRTSHAYLFCGPRGTGKTTMARIMAKALECEQGPGHLPDGTCEQCQLIAEGEHPDVYELDAASRTGVDNVREEIINRVSFAPVRGTYKVYIIDEVHMLTTAAFNALLKTLEEPPEHVVFILCTTDPQKIPETILSRVQRFDFHAIGNDLIQAHLEYVCKQEGFQYDPAAIELVVRHARGGMRDALTELEQLSVFGEGDITLAAAQDMLGEVAGSTLAKVSQALAQRDVPTVFAEVGSLVSAGRDLLQFSRELAAHLRDVYVVSAVGAREGVVDAQGDRLAQLKDEADQFGSVDRIAHALCVINDASNQMRTATNQRLVLEVAFTRICRPATDLTLESLADRVATLEKQVSALAAGGAAAGTPRPSVARVEQAAPVQAMPAATAPAQAMTEQPQAVPAQPQAEPRRRAVPQAPEAPAQSQQAVRPHAAQAAPQGQTPARPEQQAPRPQAAPAASQVPPQVSRQAPERPARPVQPAAAAQPKPAAPVAAPQARQAAQPGAVSDKGELQRRWKQVVEQLKAADPARGSLLMSASIVSDDGEALTVSLPKGSAFAAKMLERQDVKTVVGAQVAQVFGRRQVVYVEGGSKPAAPVQAAPRPARQPQAAVRPAPQPAPVPQAAPAPQPAPSPQPVPQAVAAPQDLLRPAPVVQLAQPAAPEPGYSMPWDAGLPPVEDDDPYAEYAETAPQPAPAPATSQPQRSRPSEAAAPSAQPAPPATAPAQPEARVQETPAAAPSAQPSPAEQASPSPRPAAPQAAAPAAGAAKPDAQAVRKKRAPRGPKGEPLPEDAQKVYDLLTEVFGDCEVLDVEPARDK